MPTHFVIPRRAFVLGGIVLIATAVVGIVYTRLPKATIVVHPATFERSVSQEITLSTATQEPDFVRFILPATFIEKEVIETKTINRASSKTFDDFARGTVTLYNKQDEEQRLLPQTHVRHEATGVFFLTDTPATIPPQGELAMNVTAKEKGPAGNVSAGKFVIDKLPASVQNVMYAESTTAFTGGTAVESPLTEAEIAAAKTETKKIAEENAHALLSSEAGGAGINDKLVSLTTPEEFVSAQLGSRTTEFTVRTKVVARGFFPDTNDLLSLTLLALRSSPKPDEEFVSYEPDSFTLEIVRSDFNRGEARVKGTLTGAFASKTGSAPFAIDNLAGRNEKEVHEYFEQFPSVGNVEVHFSPFWVQTVPTRPEATEIVIKSEGK